MVKEFLVIIRYDTVIRTRCFGGHIRKFTTCEKYLDISMFYIDNLYDHFKTRYRVLLLLS